MTEDRPKSPPAPERQIAFKLGLSAENRAAALLLAKGFRIAARRWRCPAGEIDIVARRGKLLIFVEVKARARLDDAAYSVTERTAAKGRGRGFRLARRPSRRCDERHALRCDPGRAALAAAAHSGRVRGGVMFLSSPRARCAPSPRGGEGWGEGARLDSNPSPGSLRDPTSPKGRGITPPVAARRSGPPACGCATPHRRDCRPPCAPSPNGCGSLRSPR